MPSFYDARHLGAKYDFLLAQYYIGFGYRIMEFGGATRPFAQRKKSQIPRQYWRSIRKLSSLNLVLQDFLITVLCFYMFVPAVGSNHV